MIFRQLYDSVSGTYSYLLASRQGGEALILDPVLEKVDRYLQLVRELDLMLVKAVDTHLHADHITGLGALRDRLPKRVLAVDSAVGTLTADWAKRTGLAAGIPVTVGAFDAHTGAIGAGVKPGTLVKIIGTSTCDISVRVNTATCVPASLT